MQIRDILIHLLHRLFIFCIKSMCILPDARYFQQYRIEFDNQAVFITIIEKIKYDEKDQNKDGEKNYRSRIQAICVKQYKTYNAGHPQEKMGENVHHRIKNGRRHCAWRSDITAQFHHTIWSATKTKGRRITKGETANREFVRMQIGKTLIG